MLHKKIMLYEDRTDVSLTTYVLDDSVEVLNGGKRGAVLICPGGAYLYCSDREGEPIAMAFSAMGYQTFVLRYSVYNENNGKNAMDQVIPDMKTPWKEKEFIKYPGPVRDIGKALLCIHEHAEEWHVDEEKIAVCGFSAGAHNCAMYAVNYNKPEITELLNSESKSIRPAAMILGYMLSDYVDLVKYDGEAMDLFQASLLAYAGDEIMHDNKYAEKVSPARNVNVDTPPMFLWATARDQLVNPMHTLKMAAALNEYQIPYELHIFEEGEHGMALATMATAAEKSQIDDDVAAWISMADKWLKKRMKIDLPK